MSVKIGGVDAPVFYAGAQGDLVGLDQIKALVPHQRRLNSTVADAMRWMIADLPGAGTPG